ncbi:phage tail length tape measure family protein [Ciceribacter sp. RN22]|uniref:phage tail length tape measure family protein n=1 Tax=Ciceribacter sp. RN22 TaxID=2954932 RepID=UPI0020931B1F|nr:phage tail length tape measure family protein [Ciceribacter sp. RN22]MCO6178814.1 phage tail length tape measure family protein [Ciceribacter sp. RN22]
MVVELRTLRITSDFDSSRYVAGMQQKVDADRKGADSSKAVGAAVDEQKVKVSSAMPVIERLSRAYIDGYGSAAKFNGEVMRLARSQDTNAASVEHLEQVYAGMQRRFGFQADATELAERGYTRLASAITNVNSRLSSQVLAAERAASANRRLAAANQNGMGGFNAANAAYQFQDIAVTSAMGMSPLMIGLQQGTQLASVVGSMQRPIAGLAAAFGSLVSPISLVTIGLTAGTAALIQYFAKADHGADGMSSDLREQAELVARVANAWGDATPRMKAYADELERAAKAADRLKAGEALAREQYNPIEDTLGRLRKPFGAAQRELTGYGADAAPALKLMTDSVVELQSKIMSGTATTSDLSSTQRALAETLDRTGTPAVRRFAEEFGRVAPQIQAAIEAAGRFRQEGSGSIFPQLGQLPGLFSEGGRLYSPEDLIPKGAVPIPTGRPRIELEGLPGETKTNEATQRSYRDIIKTAQDRIEQMKLEIQVSGLTGIAAERMRFQLEMLQEAQDKGRKITPDQRQEIERLGDAYEAAARKAASLKLQDDAQFDRDQLGRSPAEQRIASQLRGAGLPVDLNSYEAGILRANDALREQVKAWESIRDIGRDAIDQITGSAMNGFSDIKDVLKNISQDILKSITQLGISNPLKNAIYGDQLPTLESVGGIGGVFGALLGGPSPAARGGISSAASMSVTAGTVMINGSLTGGLGGLLGGNAANNNSNVLQFPGGGNLSGFAKAIQSIESSGNYGALGPITKTGDRAYGAYQIMGNNIGPWSREILGRSVSTDEFLSSRSIQDHIFNGKFGQYVGKYGPTGAAQAWFGGPGSVGRGDITDQLGTSVQQYADKFNNALGGMTSNINVAGQGLDCFGRGLGSMGQALEDAA